MVEEWFSGSGSGSDPGSGSGQVLTCAPIRLKGPKRQYFPNVILKGHVHFFYFSEYYQMCKRSGM